MPCRGSCGGHWLRAPAVGNWQRHHTSGSYSRPCNSFHRHRHSRLHCSKGKLSMIRMPTNVPEQGPPVPVPPRSVLELELATEGAATLEESLWSKMPAAAAAPGRKALGTSPCCLRHCTTGHVFPGCTRPHRMHQSARKHERPTTSSVVWSSWLRSVVRGWVSLWMTLAWGLALSYRWEPVLLPSGRPPRRRCNCRRSRPPTLLRTQRRGSSRAGTPSRSRALPPFRAPLSASTNAGFATSRRTPRARTRSRPATGTRCSLSSGPVHAGRRSEASAPPTLPLSRDRRTQAGSRHTVR
mmetsp:Transcript_55463/g.141005  ORF Transcript_55463/g.141005 Transcript_55463/m.141005 type:complete len:297 (-) Transcript_55463:618-1508(-)